MAPTLAEPSVCFPTRRTHQDKSKAFAFSKLGGIVVQQAIFVCAIQHTQM